jgi:hypothetical protein
MNQTNYLATISAALIALLACVCAGDCVTGDRHLLSPQEMATVVGGGCHTRCYNYCKTAIGEICTSQPCDPQGEEGQICSGGGGNVNGDPPTFTCVYNAGNNECELDEFSAQGWCTPIWVCRCILGEGSLTCAVYPMAGRQRGVSNCQNPDCDS